MPFIMVTVLIDMVSIGLIIPVLPALVGTFTSSQTEQAWWYGAVTFAFSFANFFASPMLGALSDRYGRRPVLLVGFCALALSFFVTALATALWMLIVVRLFSGAMQSNISVANAYVADITPPEDRAKRFGLLGAMFGIGFILGPVIGGLLGAHRPAPAVLRRRRPGPASTCSTAGSCCPNRCRPTSAGRSSGARRSTRSPR